MKKHYIHLLASADNKKLVKEVTEALNEQEQQGWEIISTQYSHTFHPDIGFNYSCMIHYIETI